MYNTAQRLIRDVGPHKTGMMKPDQATKIGKAKALAVGGPVADSEVSLCLYADAIDLESISSLLGAKPTQAVRRGDVIGRRRPARIGIWSLDAPKELTFEEKIEHLLRSTTKKRSTWDALAASHSIQLRCVLYLHSWTEGFDLPADILADIGGRHWQFGLAVYSAEGDEILEAFLSKGTKRKNWKAQQTNEN